MGYSLVTASLLVTLGRLSDMYGRVRLYNLGFLIFTVAQYYYTKHRLLRRAGDHNL
ncbi:hypothetical protein [Vulcanisaeta sp. JCM 16161]|uniref:hypothetical protein n=1 Tax=Vulcanisaeta sp. JCM 16161 TaxID=1295372 RepID=UPI000A48C41A|nr:hypothetical protein [Vulcanisaeta sp. JCM 16161]